MIKNNKLFYNHLNEKNSRFQSFNNFNNHKKYEKYVKDVDIYEENHMKSYHFNDGIDTIMVDAGMGMGKTKQLHNLINYYKDKKIVIVSFRKTLDREYTRNFEGFMLYENITMSTYDTDFYDKMVVQIDSFYKVRGKIDLLILDEFSYTVMHLIHRAKHREAVYNTLLTYIRDLNNKIIVMDALMDDFMIKWFYHQKRKIQYVHNKYKRHNNIKIINYENKVGIFTDDIIKNLKNNKKLIIPTNCKNFLKTLKNKIIKNLPNIKYKFLDADNSDDINLENWNEYNIVGYTPTIVAGISYEKIHFDKIFAYFTNNSSCAEMSLQQLFRVRNLNDNDINICIENKDSSKYLTKVEDIKQYIIDRNSCLIDGVMGVKISNIYKEVIQDSYFYLYLNCQIKDFKSRNEYENVLINLLKKQGITNIKKIKENDTEKDKTFRKEMRDNSKVQNEEIINDVIKAEEIDDDKYEILKNKINLTYNEKNMIKKKNFRKTYCYEGEISFDLYKKFSKKYQQFNNINTIYTLKDELFDYLKDKIQDIEIAKHDKHNEVIEEKEGKYGKLLSPNPFILHQSKKNEKILIGLELVKLIGADNIFNKNIFKINFKEVFKYIKEKEYIIRLLFKCKQFEYKNIDYNNIKDNNEMLKYINARLRTLFNIYIKKVNKNLNEYIIDGMDSWSEETNPFKENEDIKMEMYIKTILNNTDFDI